MSLHLLYGGTFDPIHLGHLAVARAALAASGAASLDFVPAADPPHRGVPGASFADRVDLLRAALAAEPPPTPGRWGIDAREGRRDGPSYTVDTLREWRSEHGETRPLGFVLGADAFLGLTGWREWQALPSLAHLLVARRPGSVLEGLTAELREALAGRWATDAADFQSSPAGRVAVLDLPLQPESATAVREAVAGRRPPYGLPAAVAALIAARGLYAVRIGDAPPG
ncbi:MAG: nicotinate-nucleotide adenylyltransferase [Silanimonas sp.]